MAIPPMVERVRLVIFVVMNRKIVVFEPDGFEPGVSNGFGVKPAIVRTDESIRGELGSPLDPYESIVITHSIPGEVETVEIDRRSPLTYLPITGEPVRSGVVAHATER